MSLQLKAFQFQFIFHLSLLSIILLLSSFNFITFFISLEFYSFSSIFLIFFLWRSSDKNITILGLIYFLINVIGSILILFSFLFFYSFFNIFYFKDIFYLDNIIGTSFFWKFLLLSGFFIKLGCAPFHFWVLPLYNNINSFITFFQSIIPKFIYIIIISSFYLNEYVYLISILSLLIGSLIGLNQSFLKKLLGASSIFNLGLFLIILNSDSLIYNISIYFFNIIPIFLIFFLFTKKDPYFFFHSSWKLSDFKSFSLAFPHFSFLFLIVICSLIGIPPFAGFFYKLNIFLHCLMSDQFVWLVFAILATVISSIFYLFIIQYLYSSNNNNSSINIYSFHRWDLSLFYSIFSFLISFFYFFFPYFYFIFYPVTFFFYE